MRIAINAVRIFEAWLNSIFSICNSRRLKMMNYLDLKKRFYTAMIAMVMFSAGTAQGAVLLSGGDIWTNGDFDDISYGATGLAYVKPYLFVGDLASTNKPDYLATITNLDYSYQLSGSGSSMMQVTYSITNNDALPFTDLRFMVDVQADGSDSYNDIPTGTWPAQDSGDPDQYQVVDWSLDDLPTLMVSNNSLNGTDTCGGAVCDVDFGLQWNLPSLAPGVEWQIVIGLSDDGLTLSNRYLQASSFDTANTVLTFSGTAATVVPLPASVILFASGFLCLVSIGRRRTIRLK
jgi:hypothetical protein